MPRHATGAARCRRWPRPTRWRRTRRCRSASSRPRRVRVSSTAVRGARVPRARSRRARRAGPQPRRHGFPRRRARCPPPHRTGEGSAAAPPCEATCGSCAHLGGIPAKGRVRRAASCAGQSTRGRTAPPPVPSDRRRRPMTDSYARFEAPSSAGAPERHERFVHPEGRTEDAKPVPAPRARERGSRLPFCREDFAAPRRSAPRGSPPPSAVPLSAAPARSAPRRPRRTRRRPSRHLGSWLPERQIPARARPRPRSTTCCSSRRG